MLDNTRAALASAKQAAASGIPYSNAVQSSGLLAGFRADCSGLVDWVLDHNGYNVGQDTTVGLQKDLTPGQGEITVWDRPLPGQAGHAVLEVAGQWFESGGQTGGGPHQITDAQAAAELGVTSVGELATIRQTPRGFVPLTPGRPRSIIVTASEYGGPGDPSSGTTGYRGDNLNQHPDSFAELSRNPAAMDFSALGGLPYDTPVTVTNLTNGKSLTLYKRDVGAGGPGLKGKPRAIDLWYQSAQKLGLNGLGLVRVTFTPSGSTAAGITRPGGEATGSSSGGPAKLLADWNDEVNMPRTNPAGNTVTAKNAFQWWLNSFTGRWG